jgi:hypothetical protein
MGLHHPATTRLIQINAVFGGNATLPMSSIFVRSAMTSEGFYLALVIAAFLAFGVTLFVTSRQSRR